MMPLLLVPFSVVECRLLFGPCLTSLLCITQPMFLGLFPTMALGGCPRPEHWARLQVFLSMGEHAHDQGGGHDWTWAWPASSRHRPSLWPCVRASFLVLSGLRPFDDKCRLCCSLGVAPYLDGFVFGSRDVVEATGSGGPSVGHLSLAI